VAAVVVVDGELWTRRAQREEEEDGGAEDEDEDGGGDGEVEEEDGEDEEEVDEGEGGAEEGDGGHGHCWRETLAVARWVSAGAGWGFGGVLGWGGGAGIGSARDGWCVSVRFLLIVGYGEEAGEGALDENVCTAVLHIGWSRTVLSRSLRCCDSRLSRCAVWLVNGMMRVKRRQRVDKYEIPILTVVSVVLEMHA